ncbi:MAG: hypothetical protein LH477_02085 [Nocardioides sp.]|nr:hypothetical protein [Nocardioides sp.]
MAPGRSRRDWPWAGSPSSPPTASCSVAIYASNLPEAVGSAVDMRKSGRSPASIIGLWSVVALLCAGALLTMLIDSMVPEAKDKAKDWAGLATVAGFALAAGLSLLGQ